MLKTAAILFALALSGAAHADSFIRTDCSGSNTEKQNWFYSHTGGSGTEAWTFDTCTAISNTVCNADPARCFAGEFSTTDGGTGTFASSLQIDAASCDSVPGPGTVFPAGYHYSPGVQTCDYDQFINLAYDTTGASYLGTSGKGELTRKRRYYCTLANVPATCSQVSWGVYDSSATFLDDAWSGDIYNSSWVDVGDFSCDH